MMRNEMPDYLPPAPQPPATQTEPESRTPKMSKERMQTFVVLLVIGITALILLVSGIDVFGFLGK
jgi:hypothetical protein